MSELSITYHYLSLKCDLLTEQLLVDLDGPDDAVVDGSVVLEGQHVLLLVVCNMEGDYI